MELLDVALAFALTLGALATVVSILLEVAHRIANVRRRNLIEIMRLLNAELGKAPFDFSEQERWDFIRAVVTNPARATAGLPEKLSTPTVGDALDRLGWVGRKPAFYDKVSLEHVLRRLAELPRVQALSRDAATEIAAGLDYIGRKYEEYGSAVSAAFKRRAQFWSVMIGIALALVANVDGLRIFDAFRDDGALTASVVARQGELEAAGESARERLAAIEAAAAEMDAANEALQAANAAEPVDPAAVAAARDRVAAATTGLEAATAPERIGAAVSQARTAVGGLASLGLPVGFDYFPHCRLFGSDRPQACTGAAFTAETGWAALGETLSWFVRAVLTGALIGLGAPFWFDVARRLAEVRQAFGGRGRAEDRLAGRDADSDPDRRGKIVAGIAGDAAHPARGA